MSPTLNFSKIGFNLSSLQLTKIYFILEDNGKHRAMSKEAVYQILLTEVTVRKIW